jgi:hypothetical protein
MLLSEGRGFNWEEFKADPRMQGFMKTAHAKGITNDQMSFILGEYAQRAPELVGGAAELDSEVATTQLREVWKTDAEFKQNIGLAFRAFNSLADESDKGVSTRSAITRWLSACWQKSALKCRKMRRRAAM